jgi:hypothetical protein
MWRTISILWLCIRKMWRNIRNTWINVRKMWQKFGNVPILLEICGKGDLNQPIFAHLPHFSYS